MTTSNTIGNPTPPPVPPPPQPPTASLGALTDEEQRVYNTVIAGGGNGIQSVINLRAQNAGVAAINSGAASTVTVTPKGDVTTVTTTPATTNPGANVTNTGKASATDTGVNVTVPAPPVTPVTDDDDAYVFTDANNKEIEVKTSEYDSWTPAQQLAWQTSEGLINSKPPVNTPSYVRDSTGKDTGVLAKYTNSDGTIDIQAALAGGVTADYITQHTGASLSDISTAKAINKVNSVLKANKDGTYNTDDINAAIASGKLTQADVNAVFGTQTAVKTTPISPKNQALGDGGSVSYPASYSQDNWDADIASGKIPKGATFVSYDSKTGIVNYTVPSTATVPDAIYTEINKSLIDPKQTMSGQVSALNDAIENAGYWNNSILGKTVYLGGQTFYVDAKGNILTQQDQVKIQWNNLTDTQKQTVAGLYSQDLYRTNPFAETTKQIAVAGQKGGIIGELATSPLTGITIPIAKATSGQHVTAQDVEGAVVTVVGDALMVGGGDALVSGFGNAGKVIVNTLLTGMGTVGVVDTVLQIKQGGTPGSTIAVEAALSTAALIAGAGGLVSQLVPKGTPDIDVAQQFIDKMNTQTTPEGLAKNSPFQAPSNISGDAEWGAAEEPTATPDEISKQVADVNSMQSDVKTLQSQLDDAVKSGDPTKVFDTQDKLDAATRQLDDTDSQLSKMRMGEVAYRQSELTATYKEWVESSTQYAQNQYNINDLTAKIADNRATVDAITKGTTIPDEYLAKLASDTGSMEKTLAACQEADAGLAKQVNETADRFKTTIQSYGSFAKGKGLVFDDSGTDEMLKNLPHNSADVIKSHIDLLMNGDSSPAAIARQQEVVDAADKEYQQYKSKSGQSADLGAKLTEEQSKLAMMKIGSLSQAHADLVNAREELADVNDIMENGKFNDATKTNLSKIQDQLESQIADRENVLKTQLIGGQGTQDIIKVEDIKDSQGDVVGKRIYSNEGVKRYDIDDDGNIMWETGRDESTGGGKSPNTPTETRPSPDTTTPEETGLQQTSRGMPKGGTAIVSAIGKPAVTIPTTKKLTEVSVPSTKTETTKVAPATKQTPVTTPNQKPSKTEVVSPSTKTETTKVAPSTTQTPVTNPNKQSSKTEVVSPLTETNPAINPSTVHSAAQSKSQQQIQQQQQAQQTAISKAQNEAMDQNMDQSKNQNMQQNMNQQMQKAGATATKVGTISDTETNPPPENNDKTMPPADISKPNITKDAEGFVHVPQGSATWKQGFGYRTLIPPYDQKHFIFTMKPPKGAIIAPNAKSAKDTIQKLGKGNLPQDMNVKMGIMTVDVKDPPNRPQKHSGSIAFKRIPITNNTGSRSAPPHAARFGTGITRRRDR